MDAIDFENVLWRSNCHSSKLPTILTFIPLITLIGIFFAMSVFGFGAVVITLIVLTVAGIVWIIVYGRTHRWQNPQLIFIMTETCVIFTSKNNNSYFYNEYENIADYSYVQHDERYASVTLNFRHVANAGAFGKITSMTMAKIENFELVKKILEDKEIPCVQNPTIRTQFNRSK
ncbi:MAG: hypothetical protein K2I23_06860 [Clostridia bacterium]|nr:hypothetical protein [Clostridia bacterium]